MRRIATLLAGGILLAMASPALAQQPPVPAAATVEAETDDYHGYTASVIELTPLRRQGNGENDLAVHLYGTSGGDPAMNGLNTYIAFWQSAADGHRVFQVGNFISYRLVSETKGRVVLAITENTIDGSSNIGNRSRRIAVTWTPPRDGSAPATIRVSPAR